MPPPVCQYDAVQYGDVIFTGYTKTSLNKQNVYTEDGQSVKYLKCTLEVEFILAKELIQYTTTRNFTGIDEEMDYIRSVLQAPNLYLDFTHRGAGVKTNILGKPISGPQSGYNSFFPLHISSNLIDGPFPEVLTWEPLGFNNAAKCRWRCIFNLPLDQVSNVSLASDTLTSTPPEVVLGGRIIQDPDISSRSRTYAGLKTASSIVTDYINSLLFPSYDTGSPVSTQEKIQNLLVSHSEEQEINIEEDGTVVVSLIGVFEFSGSGQMNSILSSPKAIPRLIQMLTHYFEPFHPPGFTRTQKYRYRKNRRELEYVITDRELKSDNPLMPNIIKADVAHTVESSLMSDDVFAGSGFYSWNNTFNGSITVAPGVWMGWAWIAMMSIVRQRMNRSTGTVTDIDTLKDEIDAHGVITSQKNAAVVAKQEKPKHLLHKISIKENIYNRQVDFTLNYLVTTSLNNLFVNTGLFYPVHIFWSAPAATYPNDLGYVPIDIKAATPQTYANQWNMSNEASSRVQNVFGYRGPLLPGYDMIFNPYHNQDVYRADPGGSAAIRDPEKYNGGAPAGTVSGGVGPGNTSTFAYYRRTEHLKTFNGLDFSSPDLTRAQVNQAPAGPPRQYAATGNVFYPGSQAFNSDYLKYADPERTWVSYEPRFEIIRKNNSVLFPTISSENPESRHNSVDRPSASTRSYVGFTINGMSNAPNSNSNQPNISDYVNSPIQTFGKPATYIRFSGQAVRALYPIATPTLVGCQNRKNQSDGSGTVVKAYQVGEANWSTEMLNASSEIPLFYATWSVVYALQGDPTSGSIGFQTSHASEFLG